MNKNKVANALSRIFVLLGMIVVKLMRLESMKDDFEVNEDFDVVLKASRELLSGDKTLYLNYFIQEGYMF